MHSATLFSSKMTGNRLGRCDFRGNLKRNYHLEGKKTKMKNEKRFENENAFLWLALIIRRMSQQNQTKRSGILPCRYFCFIYSILLKEKNDGGRKRINGNKASYRHGRRQGFLRDWSMKRQHDSQRTNQLDSRLWFPLFVEKITIA